MPKGHTLWYAEFAFLNSELASQTQINKVLAKVADAIVEKWYEEGDYVIAEGQEDGEHGGLLKDRRQPDLSQGVHRAHEEGTEVDLLHQRWRSQARRKAGGCELGLGISNTALKKNIEKMKNDFGKVKVSRSTLETKF